MLYLLKNKIDEILEWLFILYPERKKILEDIKNVCSRYHIHSKFREMYINIQNRILNGVKKKTRRRKISQRPEKEMAASLIKSRMFELSEEFTTNFVKSRVHSANSLARQVIELYLVTAYTNYSKDYKRILGNGKNFPSYRNIREELKKNDLWPNIKGITREQFFGSLIQDYRIFSDLLHPKQDTFIYNLWIAERKKDGNFENTRSYKKQEINNNSIIFLFSKKTPFHPEYLKKVIHSFYTYLGFTLGELDDMVKIKKVRGLK